jgi:glycosyltransferase domain-containing protein
MKEQQISLAPLKESSYPLVTVGLPVYNRPAGLSSVLECILKQTYSNLEIIISDNCSPDSNIQSIIAAAVQKDGRIKAYRQPINIGLEGNFNYVYAQAMGKYFMWMSDDDSFDENYIEECVKFLEQNSDYALCSGQAVYYTNGEYTFTENMFPLYQRSAFARVSNYFNRMQQNGKFYGVFRNHLLSAEPLEKSIGCDWSFMAKMAAFGKLTFTPTTKLHRAIGGNSVNRKKLVTRYGYKGLKNIFLETYSAYLIATNIFTDPAVKSKLNFLYRTCLVLIVFVKVNWLHLVNAVRRRLPVNKKVRVGYGK